MRRTYLDPSPSEDHRVHMLKGLRVGEYANHKPVIPLGEHEALVWQGTPKEVKAGTAVLLKRIKLNSGEAA